MGDSDDRMDLDSIDMTVRELMTEIKDTSEVIVDLAYASLMYNSREMADKVAEMEGEIDELKYALRIKLLLAARTREEAKQLSGILQVASAADMISRAAGDIVKLLDVPKENRPFINTIIDESDEKIRMARISPKSDMVGFTIEQLAVEACTGTKIIALKNRKGWLYDPDDGVKIHAGDDIIVSYTSDDGFDRLARFARGDMPWEFPEEEGGA